MYTGKYQRRLYSKKNEYTSKESVAESFFVIIEQKKDRRGYEYE